MTTIYLQGSKENIIADLNLLLTNPITDITESEFIFDSGSAHWVGKIMLTRPTFDTETRAIITPATYTDDDHCNVWLNDGFFNVVDTEADLNTSIFLPAIEGVEPQEDLTPKLFLSTRMLVPPANPVNKLYV
jgi:hypothetical protein